jgi:hypothetical protein
MGGHRPISTKTEAGHIYVCQSKPIGRFGFGSSRQHLAVGNGRRDKTAAIGPPIILKE